MNSKISGQLLLPLDKRAVITLSGGLTSGVRLWLARVMHSSNVLMKVAQVALRRDACREMSTRMAEAPQRHKCEEISLRSDVLPLRRAWLPCQQCAVIGWFGPVGPGGHSTDEVQTSSS